MIIFTLLNNCTILHRRVILIDFHRQDEDGDTPIHDAIIAKNNTCVAFLCGAPNINLKICNGKGLSPLHLAAMKDDELLVKLLYLIIYTEQIL